LLFTSFPILLNNRAASNASPRAAACSASGSLRMTATTPRIPSSPSRRFFSRYHCFTGCLPDVTQRREVEESPRQRLAALADAQLPLVHPAGSLGEIQPHGLAIGAATAVVTWVTDAHPEHAGGGDAHHLAQRRDQLVSP